MGLHFLTTPTQGNVYLFTETTKKKMHTLASELNPTHLLVNISWWKLFTKGIVSCGGDASPASLA